MAHRFDDDIDYETRREPERRPWIAIAIVAGLVILGAASALLWRAYNGGVPALPSFASVAAPGAASPEAADKAVGLKDFQALQQQIAASLQASAQVVAAQQAEIKRLSDQVSALAAKIETLQHSAASAQAAAPVPPPPPPPPARKKPAAAKPPPGISTGGAPLPLTER
ncbi:MAG TPA: hypothetical protein VGO49_14770 [Bradyrhizobium sp.]|nr:hypothetical protein [Bradyrhizobium sp.]